MKSRFTYFPSKVELNLLAYRSGGGGGGLHRNLAFVGSWVRIPLLWPLKRCQMTVPAQQLRAYSIKHFLIVIYGQMSINWQWYFPNLCEHLSPKFGHSYEFVIYISVKLVRIAPLISSILIT